MDEPNDYTEGETVEGRETSPLPFTDLLSGLRVEVSPFMEGQKRAVQINETVYVSPAMYDLMKHADQEELQHLLANIEVLDMGKYDPFRAVSMKSVTASYEAPDEPKPLLPPWLTR